MANYLRIVSDSVDSSAERLHQIAQYLWENPEVKFEEHKAHDYITNFLEAEGFPVQRNYILPTAFRAEIGGKALPGLHKQRILKLWLIVTDAGIPHRNLATWEECFLHA